MSKPEDMSREQLIGEVCKLRHEVKTLTNARDLLLEHISERDLGCSDYANLMLDTNIWTISEAVSYLDRNGFTDREIKEILGLDD